MTKAADPNTIERDLALFSKLFPGKRLLCLRLDGFSHHIYMDSGNRGSEIESVEVSFYVSQAEWNLYLSTQKDMTASKAARQFLIEIGKNTHTPYQGNPLEIIYIEPKDR